MPKYVVEALSQYRMVYVIEADSRDAAEDSVMNDDVPEFAQVWLGEMTVFSRQTEDDEIVDINDELNQYLKDFTREQKLARVYKAKA